MMKEAERMLKNIIHIGYHKTGTTWFQNIYYPAVLNFEFVHRKRVREAILLDHPFHFKPEKAVSKLACSTDKPLILCEENLSGNIFSGGLYGYLSIAAAERLHAVLPDSRIVIFIRNQPDMIASVYKQYIRQGGTHSQRRFIYPERFLSETGFRPVYTPLFSFHHFEYYPLIKHYIELFGRDQVHIFLFEEMLGQDDFPEQFARIFDFELGTLSSLPPRKLNPSYRGGILRLARLVNYFSRRDVIDKRYFLDVPGNRLLGKVLKRLNDWPIFGGSPGPEQLFDRDTLEDIMGRYRSWNRCLVDEFGLDLERYGYPL